MQAIIFGLNMGQEIIFSVIKSFGCQCMGNDIWPKYGAKDNTWRNKKCLTINAGNNIWPIYGERR